MMKPTRPMSEMDQINMCIVADLTTGKYNMILKLQKQSDQD